MVLVHSTKFVESDAKSVAIDLQLSDMDSTVDLTLM